eukprot:5974559-Prorocentrum_lima.AAC.1
MPFLFSVHRTLAPASSRKYGHGHMAGMKWSAVTSPPIRYRSSFLTRLRATYAAAGRFASNHT